MELTPPITSGAPRVTLGPRPSVLSERAASLLSGGPVDSATVVREVCQIPVVAAALADHLAAALLAGDPRFSRRFDGRWELTRPETSISLSQMIDAMSYVVVDVETTGTRLNDGDRVTEVAVVEVHANTSRVVFDSLINPERPIPPYITGLTSISQEMVRHAPVFGDIAVQLAAVLEGHVFVAHNASFDWRFISAEMQRATGRPLTGTKLCTVRMARRLLPTLRRRSLDHVTAFFGISIGARHRAGGDAIATAEVLQRLLGAARDAGISTYDDLVSHLRAPRKKRTRPPAMPHGVVYDTTA